MTLRQWILPALTAAMLGLGGCGSTGSTEADSNVTLRILVSSLHYVKEANASLSNTSETGEYRFLGLYDFYDENVSGVRIVRGGGYITNEYNESNYSVAPVQCPQFSVDMNDTGVTLKAPADEEGEFAYINVNPFTTLLVDSNYSLDELQLRFPVAASLERRFNFDTVAARKLVDSAEENLTAELCEALYELLP